MNSFFEELSAQLADILDIRDAVPETTLVLADYPLWDSMAHLVLLAWFRERCGITVTAQELRELKTVGDVQQLLISRQNRTL